ncbi:MAG TPA: tail fiber domain-containing protein [Thermoanaerobaculia bacterium]|nr:tail fiber domain-containing protein [Thermoanaerobaculia bacterium]
MASLDLQVAGPLSSTPQVITDTSQNDTPSGVYLTSATSTAPGTVSVTSSGKVVFGIAAKYQGTGGDGEWVQNTSAGTGSNFGLAFYGNHAEQMRLTNSGQLGIGTTAPSATLHVNGTVRFQGLQTSTGEELVIDGNGNVFIEASSARFKENIRELKEDFRKLLSLRPVAFEYKDSGAPSVGYLAEEVAEQGLESLVMNDGEGKPFSVRYKMIPVYLVELVKQQQALIERLQEQIAEVQQRLLPTVG